LPSSLPFPTMALTTPVSPRAPSRPRSSAARSWRWSSDGSARARGSAGRFRIAAPATRRAHSQATPATSKVRRADQRARTTSVATAIAAPRSSQVTPPRTGQRDVRTLEHVAPRRIARIVMSLIDPVLASADHRMRGAATPEAEGTPRAARRPARRVALLSSARREDAPGDRGRSVRPPAPRRASLDRLQSRRSNRQRRARDAIAGLSSSTSTPVAGKTRPVVGTTRPRRCS